MKHYRVLMIALVAFLLVAAVACESDGRRFDPTSILDPASDSDGQFLADQPGGDDDGLVDVHEGDGDDDDDDCRNSDSDDPDEYDDEMFPDGDPDGDDDDDDDC